jgi:AcrR family transcriptional regulator
MSSPKSRSRGKAGASTERPSPDRERTYRRLLRTAIGLFAARGYHGVSVDDVAAAARVSKRMPYYYFGSKVSLYRAALLEVYRRIEGMELQVVGAADSPSQKLAGLLEGYFQFLLKNPEFTQLLMWGNLEKGRHFPKGLLTKTPLLRRFRQVVEEGVEAGEFRADLDVRHLLINVIGLSFIYFSNRYSLAQVLDLDLDAPAEHRRAIEQIRSVLLDGVRTMRFRAATGHQ